MSLTNQDFRRLMMTPRPGAAPGGNERKALTEEELQERARKKQDRSAYYIRLQQQKQLRDKSLQYNDRAAQRRKKEREDRRNGAEGQVGINADGTEEVDTTNMSVEETKLLGGDIEHTHLVKGLDYALLEKRRMEIDMENAKSAQALNEKKKKGDDEHGMEDEDDEGGMGDEERGNYQPISDLAKRIYRMFDTSAAGRSNANGNDDASAARKGPSIFVKNRVIYRYKFDEDDTTPVPVTVLMNRNDAGSGNFSKADESNLEADAIANRLILSKIGNIMKLKDKLKKKSKEEEEALYSKGGKGKAGIENEDEDEDLEIFPGAGKYDLPMLEKREKEGDNDEDEDVFMVPSNGSFIPMNVSGYLSAVTDGKQKQSEGNDDGGKESSSKAQKGKNEDGKYMDVTEEELYKIRKLRAQKALQQKRALGGGSDFSGQKKTYGIDPAMKKYFSSGTDDDNANRARPKSDFMVELDNGSERSGGSGLVDEYASYYPGDDELSFSQIKNRM